MALRSPQPALWNGLRHVHLLTSKHTHAASFWFPKDPIHFPYQHSACQFHEPPKTHWLVLSHSLEALRSTGIQYKQGESPSHLTWHRLPHRRCHHRGLLRHHKSREQWNVQQCLPWRSQGAGRVIQKQATPAVENFNCKHKCCMNGKIHSLLEGNILVRTVHMVI